ncbi:hypothetical protein M413DRAFT_112381 [Hebeloma cylindrosporum]|uniref:Uncharacterized protein n=1 Tax=Hebeloma cylindrosporum TaxID=76867 RepID=A0A0C2Z924_HEBCY|nr:hypothetical protein M413DRAFT_112381 [Hebeloma cylindrosporum h7]
MNCPLTIRYISVSVDDLTMRRRVPIRRSPYLCFVYHLCTMHWHHLLQNRSFCWPASEAAFAWTKHSLS